MIKKIYMGLFLLFYIILSSVNCFAASTPFVNYELSKNIPNAQNVIKIKNLSNQIQSISAAKRLNTIQTNGHPIGCSGGNNSSTDNIELCYYNTVGGGIDARVGGLLRDSSGRLIFVSGVYGTHEDSSYRLYFPFTNDKIGTEAMRYIWANYKQGSESQNFKYYGYLSAAVGYNWWSSNGGRYRTPYYDGKWINGLSPAQIRADASANGTNPDYREGLSVKGGEKGEYRYLGLTSDGDTFGNDLFPVDYPSDTNLERYGAIDNPWPTLTKYGWGSWTSTDANYNLKMASLNVAIPKLGLSGNASSWYNKVSVAGNPNYDPFSLVAVNSSRTRYIEATVANASHTYSMNAKEIVVCRGSLESYSQCKEKVGSWETNGKNYYYANSFVANGAKPLVYGQDYTVFVKIHNDSFKATSIQGTAQAAGKTVKQGTSIPAHSDSEWIASKPFRAGNDSTSSGTLTLLAGVSGEHINSYDDTDLNDNLGAIKFNIIPAGDMKIVDVKAYDSKGNEVTDLENGKEYKFEINTRFDASEKGWSSDYKIKIPLDVTVKRIFANGSSETSNTTAYMKDSAYQILKDGGEYKYTVYASAGQPGTTLNINANFSKKSTSGVNSIIDSSDSRSVDYKIKTISGDVSASLIKLIDEQGNYYSVTDNTVDSSKRYRLVFETTYNGDVVSKTATPVKTDYSCYFTDVTDSTAKIECSNLSGLVEDKVTSAKVVIDKDTYTLTPNASGKVWTTPDLNISGNKKLILKVNDVDVGLFYHDLSSAVYRGAGYPVINNVGVKGLVTDIDTDGGLRERSASASFNLDFTTVAAGNGKNVKFESTTQTYYAFPSFNNKIFFRTDENGFARNATFKHLSPFTGKEGVSEVNNLNTNLKNDTLTVENKVNIKISNVKVYPGKDQIKGPSDDKYGVEQDKCPVYEVRYDVNVDEQSILSNAQGLVKVNIKIAGETYSYQDYLVEGNNVGISHILLNQNGANPVDCNKIADGDTEVTVTINPDRAVDETTLDDNTGTATTELKIVPWTPTVEEGMDVEKDMGATCSSTTNSYTVQQRHTIRKWTKTSLGDVVGFVTDDGGLYTETKTYRESYKITNVQFASKSTKWKYKNINTSNPDAVIKAGYGFKLKVQVVYDSNILANNIELNNNNFNTKGTQVSNLNVEANIPSVIYAEYDGTTYSLSVSNNPVDTGDGKIIADYQVLGTYEGKVTNKIYTDENRSDGLQKIKITTPKILGIPTITNRCLQDTKEVSFTIKGSMYDDMKSSITQ